MTTIGKVKQVGKSDVLVTVLRNGACCGDCGCCSGCSGETVEVRATCDIDVSVGSTVELNSRSGYVLLGMTILFLLPVFLPVIGYSVISGYSITAAGIAAVILFAVSAIAVKYISVSDRYLKKVQPSVIRVVNKK